MVLTNRTIMKDGNAPTRAATTLKHKRRYCKVEGCCRIVKSQGVCQRHGAKPRKCKVESCPKQSQGCYQGMCKAHFRSMKNNELPRTTNEQGKSLHNDVSGIMCQPVLVPQDTPLCVVSEDSSPNLGLQGDQSTMTASSAVTDEDDQGRDLWDEPLLYSNGARSEELAADLFGLLPEASTSTTCEEWSGGQMSRKEEIESVGDRLYAVSSIPSCSDYSPNYYSNYQRENRDAHYKSSSYTDYYFHENASAREAV